MPSVAARSPEAGIFLSCAVHLYKVGCRWMLSRSLHLVLFVGARKRYAYKNRVYAMPY